MVTLISHLELVVVSFIYILPCIRHLKVPWFDRLHHNATGLLSSVINVKNQFKLLTMYSARFLVKQHYYRLNKQFPSPPACCSIQFSPQWPVNITDVNSLQENLAGKYKSRWRINTTFKISDAYIKLIGLTLKAASVNKFTRISIEKLMFLCDLEVMYSGKCRFYNTE